LAAGEGFEPSQTESESGVLPLHKPATRKEYYTEFRKFVKHKFPPGKTARESAPLLQVFTFSLKNAIILLEI
jgi:hypothetical protein